MFDAEALRTTRRLGLSPSSSTRAGEVTIVFGIVDGRVTIKPCALRSSANVVIAVAAS